MRAAPTQIIIRMYIYTYINQNKKILSCAPHRHELQANNNKNVYIYI